MLADLLNIRGKFGRMMVFCQNYLYYCVKTPSAVESQMLSAGRKYNYSIYRVNVKLMLQIEEELVVENCSRILMNSLDKHKDAVATQCGRYLYLLVTEDDWWYINKIRLHDFMLISSYRITSYAVSLYKYLQLVCFNLPIRFIACFSRRGFLFYGQKIIHFVKNDTFLALTEMTSFNTYGTMLRTSFFELNFDEVIDFRSFFYAIITTHVHTVIFRLKKKSLRKN
jgi:hypothetical protein